MQGSASTLPERRRCVRLARALALAALFLPSALAQVTVNWVGGSSSWTTGSNWTGGVAPTNTSFVAQLGLGNAALNTAISIAGLQLSGTGTLSGAGTLTLAGPTISTWQAGTLSGTGTLQIASGAFLELTGSGTKTYNRADGFGSGGRTIENLGTITVLGSGNLMGGDGAGIVNQAGALFDLKEDIIIGHTGGGDTPGFTNHGTIRKSAAAGTAIFSTGAFTMSSTGVVEASSGGITFAGPVTANGGTFNAGAVTTISFSGGQTFNTGTSFLGLGTISLTAGTTTMSGAITSENLRFAGGSLLGTATVSGVMQWTDGAWSGTGTLSIAAGSSLQLVGTANKVYNRNDGFGSGGRIIENHGTLEWSGTGQLLGGDGAQIINRPTGEMIVASSATLGHTGGGASPTVTNQGLFVKTEVSGTTTISGLSFVNTGTVRGETGTLAFTGSVTSNGGVFHTLLGSTLTFAGGQTFNTGTTLNAEGAIRILAGDTTVSGTITSANAEFAGGNLLGAATVAGTMQWTGGAWRSANVLTFASGSWLTVSGASTKTLSRGDGFGSGGRTLRTSGVLEWTDAGQILGNDGAGIDVLALGFFKIRNDSTYYHGGGGEIPFLTNAGTVRKYDSTGTTTFNSVAFTNTGRLEILSGTLALTGSGGLANNGIVEVQAGTLTSSANGMTSTGGTFDVFSGAQLRFTGGTNTIVGATFTGAGATEVAGGTLLVSSSTLSGNLRLLSGTIGGGGVFTTASGGVFTWQGGNLNGTGTLSILAGGQLNIEGAGAKSFFRGDGFGSGGRTISNAGTTTWSGGGTISGGDGAHFQNQATGVFDITGNSSFDHTGGGASPTFTNSGLVVKSGGGGLSTFNLAFTNTGVLRSESGTLRLSAGGSGNGQFIALAGVIDFASSYTLNNGAKILGAGNTRITGGTITVPGGSSVSIGDAISNGLLALQGGSIDGAGTLLVQSLGRMDWSAGSLRGTGTLQIATGGVLNILETVNHEFVRGDGFGSGGRTIENFGTIAWSAGNLLGGDGAQIINHPGGLFDITTAGTLGHNGAGSLPIFNNAGVLRKSSGATTTVSSLPFTTSGTVEVISGTLAFASGVTSNAGTFFAEAGATLTFSGGQTFNTGTSLLGAGSTRITAGTTTIAGNLALQGVEFAGGSLWGTGTITSGVLDWTGGDLRGANTLTIAPGAMLRLSGAGDRAFLRGDGFGSSGRVIENHGLVRIENSGNLAGSDGAQLINRAGGVVDLRNNAAFVHGGGGDVPAALNQGIFSKTSGVGTSTIAVAFTNAGTISASSGTLAFTSSFTNTNGSFAVLNGATISLPSALATGSGSITGTGTLTTSAVTAGGLVSPGVGVGTLAVTGNLTLLSTSMLLVELGAGTGPGIGHDFMNVGGNALVGGTLGVHLLTGFAPPAPGATFTVFTAGGASGLTGAFGNIANGGRIFTSDGFGSFQVNYGVGSAFAPNSVVLSHFAAVPEPSTWVLLGVGGAVILFSLLRRTNQPASRIGVEQGSPKHGRLLSSFPCWSGSRPLRWSFSSRSSLEFSRRASGKP